METTPPQEADELLQTDRGLVKKFVSALKKRTPRFKDSTASLGLQDDSIRRAISRSSNLTSHLVATEMPSEEELNSMFMEVMLDAGMPRERLTETFLAGRSREDKWNFVRNSGRLHELSQAKYTPEYFVRLLGASDETDHGALVEKVHPELLKKETATCLRIQLSNQSIT